MGGEEEGQQKNVPFPSEGVKKFMWKVIVSTMKDISLKKCLGELSDSHPSFFPSY